MAATYPQVEFLACALPAHVPIQVVHGCGMRPIRVPNLTLGTMESSDDDAEHSSEWDQSAAKGVMRRWPGETAAPCVRSCRLTIAEADQRCR